MRVFRHRLLQHFMLSLFCKLPVQPMTRIVDMRAAFMVRAPPPLGFHPSLRRNTLCFPGHLTVPSMLGQSSQACAPAHVLHALVLLQITFYAQVGLSYLAAI